MLKTCPESQLECFEIDCGSELIADIVGVACHVMGHPEALAALEWQGDKIIVAIEGRQWTAVARELGSYSRVKIVNTSDALRDLATPPHAAASCAPSSPTSERFEQSVTIALPISCVEALRHLIEMASANGITVIGLRTAALKGAPVSAHLPFVGRQLIDDHPKLLVCLRGPNCGETLRRILGPGDPTLAKRTDPDSVNAKFGSAIVLPSISTLSLKTNLDFAFPPELARSLLHYSKLADYCIDISLPVLKQEIFGTIVGVLIRRLGSVHRIRCTERSRVLVECTCERKPDLSAQWLVEAVKTASFQRDRQQGWPTPSREVDVLDSAKFVVYEAQESTAHTFSSAAVRKTVEIENIVMAVFGDNAEDVATPVEDLCTFFDAPAIIARENEIPPAASTIELIGLEVRATVKLSTAQKEALVESLSVSYGANKLNGDRRFSKTFVCACVFRGKVGCHETIKEFITTRWRNRALVRGDVLFTGDADGANKIITTIMPGCSLQPLAFATTSPVGLERYIGLLEHLWLGIIPHTLSVTKVIEELGRSGYGIKDVVVLSANEAHEAVDIIIGQDCQDGFDVHREETDRIWINIERIAGSDSPSSLFLYEIATLLGATAWCSS
ncbi:hypothetical protein Pmar_PMAR009794 [Perkinsus marinus ATCC 50983]|uniref:Uncharacterized protein n=1 Tax=Perkinsus marinus (strain ATCC 50983 / TXsc) TaxID=423536 RepID=C5KV41_PERM5|nr:hypothetical protein Pmar_PMAR009794 [Perkinsus marinus ATCC 50983]EER11587.1 hypothetical protein Pmar_PMAR009794 [Perkinsus marinus ATCC 50983]|eukprot:XP_002779792.1 hypothetical protein Pmar_PMAR009794 [Perkinsus marinus ATCC 50983]